MNRLIELIAIAYVQSVENGCRRKADVRYGVMRMLYGEEELPVSTHVISHAVGKLFDKFGVDFEDTHNKLDEMELYLDELLTTTLD